MESFIGKLDFGALCSELASQRKCNLWHDLERENQEATTESLEFDILLNESKGGRNSRDLYAYQPRQSLNSKKRATQTSHSFETDFWSRAAKYNEKSDSSYIPLFKVSSERI